MSLSAFPFDLEDAPQAGGAFALASTRVRFPLRSDIIVGDNADAETHANSGLIIVPPGEDAHSVPNLLNKLDKLLDRHDIYAAMDLAFELLPRAAENADWDDALSERLNKIADDLKNTQADPALIREVQFAIHGAPDLDPEDPRNKLTAGPSL